MRFARVAVTGARGRLGTVLVRELEARGATVRALSRPEYELDDAASAATALTGEPPDLVIHAAAWTDVDGCARDPALALQRNGLAVKWLAAACRERGTALVHDSTNEVFDERRTDGEGYRESDTPAPINPYGESKLAGERFAQEEFEGAQPPLWIVRTAWLFGKPGDDFPVKILRAARGRPRSEALRVVSDEFASPTYGIDLAAAIVRLVDTAPGAIYHLTNGGRASRFDWASAVLESCRQPTRLEPIPATEFARASQPPSWGVLDTSRAASHGVSMRAWQDAFRDYVPVLCPEN